jgi:hypothetical protein
MNILIDIIIGRGITMQECQQNAATTRETITACEPWVELFPGNMISLAYII